MSIISIIQFLTALIILILGFLVYKRASSLSVKRIFLLMCISLAFWVFCSTSADVSRSYLYALFWTRMAIIGPFFFAAFFLLFSYYFPNKDQISIRKVFFIILPPFLTLPFIQTTFNVEKIIIKDDWTDFEPGYLYTILLVFFLVYVGMGIFRFNKKSKKYYGLPKMQIKYVLIGIISVVVFGIITNLILPSFGYGRASVFGPSSTIFFVCFIGYAIVRYRLMDIRLIFTRSIIYAVLVLFVNAAFISVTYISSLYIAEDSFGNKIGSFIITAFLVVIFLEPLKKLLARITNQFFFKAEIDYPALTRELTSIINEEIVLSTLVKRFSDAVQKQLHLQGITILLSVGKDNFIEPEELISANKSKRRKARELSSGFLIKELNKSKKILIIDELDRKIADSRVDQVRNYYEKVREEFDSTKAYTIVPILNKERLDAIILLSRKLSGEAFSDNDIQLFEVLAPQMASGIQKARLYQEAKEFGVKLQKEVKKATADLVAANEKLKELDVAKSEFMSIASHQLRTPLTGIMGYLSMITDGDYGEVNPEQKPVLKDSLEATKRLIRMVNIFLNATRIEAGRFILNYSNVPFHESIEAVYKELKPTADAKKVTLTYEKSELPNVDVDPDKIKDVILNLIDNAIKYSPEGAVKVWGTSDKKNVHVYVKDTGVGIPKDEAPNLFNKFTRGSGIARVEPNGSGLGLFIAKKIVEEHGGRIWVESEGEGKGSTFQFEIPIKANPDAVAKAEEMKARVKRSAAAT